MYVRHHTHTISTNPVKDHSLPTHHPITLFIYCSLTSHSFEKILFMRVDERGQQGGGSSHPFPRERECFSAFGDKRDRNFWKRCDTAPLVVQVRTAYKW